MDVAQDLLPPSKAETFEPLDDFTLKPLDSLAMFDRVDRTVTLDIKMNNLGDGAN